MEIPRAETDRKLPGETPCQEIVTTSIAGVEVDPPTDAVAATVDVENQERRPTGCDESASQ